MYCVIRFSNPSSTHLQSIGESLNRIQPDLYDGFDRGVPNRFSCSVAPGDDWGSQRQGVFDFVTKCGEVIRNAQALGTEVVFDLAVEPEDYKDRYITPLLLDRELIDLLSERQLDFGITIYGLKE
jgi:hypothetical protein